MTTSAPAARSFPSSGLADVLLLGAGTAASWFAWLGWDHEYQTNPVTGIASRPYEAWQVAGCVLTLLVIGVLALVRRVPGMLAGATITGTLTAAWCVTEMPGDDTGLSGFGALMVLAGTGFATWLWFGLASAIRSGRR